MQDSASGRGTVGRSCRRCSWPNPDDRNADPTLSIRRGLDISDDNAFSGTQVLALEAGFRDNLCSSLAFADVNSLI
jgi:hypothetical protein